MPLRSPTRPPHAEPLPVECLEPVRAGIAASRSLWEPLLDEARVRPVELLTTDGYDVRLEAHGRHPRWVAGDDGGAVHLITPVVGDLVVRYPSQRHRDGPAGRIVSTGRTVAGDDGGLLIGSATPGLTFAVHVRSPGLVEPIPTCPWAPVFGGAA
jgi:hypothetical protein